MQIIVKTKNIKLTQEISDHLQEKIKSLKKFGKVFQISPKKKDNLLKKKDVIEALVDIGRETLHHKKGQIFFATGQINFPGRTVKASVQSDDLKKAINQLKDELEIEIKKNKEKFISLSKRKERAAKKTFHLSSQARFWRKGRILEEGI